MKRNQVDPKKQFRPLSKFGNAFLNRFQCSGTNSQVIHKRIEVILSNSIKRRVIVFTTLLPSGVERYFNRGHPWNS